MNTATFVEGTLQEFRHAARMLRLNPAFSFTAILTLALGIGATTAMFTVVNGVVIKPLSYPDSEAIVTVTHSVVFGKVRINDFPFSPQMLAIYRPNGQAFEEMGISTFGQAAITGLGDPETAFTVWMSQGVLPILGIQPALGRWFSPAEHQPGAPEAVILTSGYFSLIRAAAVIPSQIGIRKSMSTTSGFSCST